MDNPDNVDEELAAKQVRLLLASIRLERQAAKIFAALERTNGCRTALPLDTIDPLPKSKP
jgi:hypothetical protein